jgi:molecular chaperone DnaK
MAHLNQHLGTLTLEDMVPLPRGEGRYEVVFHVDADGILQVEATELHTGTSREARIASAHILSSEEIRRMVADAVAHREADLADAEAVRSAIRADSMLRAAELVLDELDSGAPDREEGEPGRLQETIDLLRDALARDEKTRIDTLTGDLESRIRRIKGHRTCDAKAEYL